MSQNEDPSTASASSAADDVPIDSNTTVDLQIISPSVGVNGPISLPQLSTSTTVRQLKEKIREILAVRPSIDSQRLIHSGRMLSRDSEALSEIFGRDINRSSGPRTLHLVLRPSASEYVVPNPSQSTSSNTHTPQEPRAQHGVRLPQMPNLTTPHNPPANPFAASTTQMQESMQRLQRSLDRLRAGHQPDAAGIPSPHIFGTAAQGTAGLPAGASPFAVQNPHQLPLPTFQNLLAQQQQQRAAQGFHGVQQGNGQIPGVHGMPPFAPFPIPTMPRMGGQNQQGVGPTRTYSQEGVGPNGDRWRINVTESVVPVFNQRQNQHQNEVPPTGSPSPNPSPSLLDQPGRSSSAPPPMNNRPHIPATSNSFSTPTMPDRQAASNSIATPTARSPLVYILSSPNGPRALLVNGNGESFHSPRPTSATLQAGVPSTTTTTTFPELRNRMHRPHRHRRPRNGNGAANDAAAAIPQLHPHNPVAAGLFRGLVGPNLWLIVRLLVFVWFFIAPNSSWWRVFTIWGIALIIFCSNAGMFRGAADTLFGPVRRHLQRLIPLHGPEQPVEPVAQPQDPLAPEGGRRGELDPARVAARLVAQHRAENESWFITQLRRVEHGAVLFLASLVPGIGERHIAAREAEANVAAVAEAERLRQEEAAANPVVEEVEENLGSEQGATSSAGTGTGAGAEGETHSETEGQSVPGEDTQEHGADRTHISPLVEA